MRLAVSLFLFAHGLAHLVGFVVPWRLMKSDEVPYKTTVLWGALELGDVGIRIVGLLWLLLALGFAALSVGVWVSWGGAYSALWGVTALSLVACLASLPEARVGVAVNVIIIVAMLAAPWIPALRVLG